MEDIIKHNPMLKKPVLTVLALAHDASCRTALELAALDRWSESFSQSPATVIDVLVRHGFLAQQAFVDGQPYAGTLEDMQLDESVPDDACAEELISLTGEGRALVAAYDPEATLAALYEDCPRHASIFDAVLAACAAEEGASREALEATIEGLAPKGADGKKVYPQYFLDALETAGALVWDGSWRATDAARTLLGPQ